MAFETLGNNNSSGDDRPQVDWEAFNKYVVDTCELKSPETMIGVVSGIISLGTQVPKPSEFLKGADEDEEAEIKRSPHVSYEDREKFFNDNKWHTNVRVKVVPQKPQQLVALTIDFPGIMIDKGKFFGGTDGEVALRMIHGGEFYTDGQRVVAKPISLKMTKGDKTGNKWTIPYNNTLYKMAVASRVIEQGDAFMPEMIDRLLGKAMQFKVQVTLNDKGYMVERCAFAASLARGMAVPEYDQNVLFLIQMTAENEDSAIKQLNRSGVSIKNTIQMASEWAAGCSLRTQLEAASKAPASAKPAEEKSTAKAQEDKQPQVVDSFLEGFDDDIPF